MTKMMMIMRGFERRARNWRRNWQEQGTLISADVHTAANSAIGIVNINTATIAQLKAKRAWLREQNGGVFDD